MRNKQYINMHLHIYLYMDFMELFQHPILYHWGIPPSTCVYAYTRNSFKWRIDNLMWFAMIRHSSLVAWLSRLRRSYLRFYSYRMCFLFHYTLNIDVVTNSFLPPLFLLYIDINVFLDFCFVFVCSFVLLFAVVGMNP